MFSHNSNELSSSPIDNSFLRRESTAVTIIHAISFRPMQRRSIEL